MENNLQKIEIYKNDGNKSIGGFKNEFREPAIIFNINVKKKAEQHK